MVQQLVPGAVRRAPLWLRSQSAATKDGVLAVGLTFLGQVELLTAGTVEGSPMVQSVAFLTMTGSVAWRRTRPVVAAGVLAAGLAVQTLAGAAEVVAGFLAYLVVTYSVASYSNLRRAVAGGGLILLSALIYPLVEDMNFADEVGNGAIFLGTWVLGRTVSSRQRQAVEAEGRALTLEHEREERLRSAIAEERRRIARELHDIVAHGISVMVLQTGAARQTVERDPRRVPPLLSTVEQIGRQALDEMHRLLGVLRGGDEEAPLAPALSLGAIDGLVADVRQTGLAVDCRVEGEPHPLPPGLEVSAYRIIQEALTNTIRHAEATAADVVIRYDTGELELRVTDNGRCGPDPTSGQGHGLIGMRERAGLFGGSVTAGSRPDGGWSVHARLPVPPSS
jgi:signal transduction histidine kinase